MKDTITERELTEIHNKSVTMTRFSALRFALAEVGITVVPDPIPEPEGDVIVLDADGDAWRLSNGMWRSDNRTVNWLRLLQYGPVKIYRAEEDE